MDTLQIQFQPAPKDLNKIHEQKVNFDDQQINEQNTLKVKEKKKLQTQISEMTEEIDDLKKDILKKNKEIGTQQTKFKNLESKLETSKKENDKINKQLLDARCEINSLQMQNDEQYATITKMKRDYLKLSQKLKKNEAENTKKNFNQNLENENYQLKNIRELNKQKRLVSKFKNIEELQKSRKESYKQEFDNLIKQLNTYEPQLFEFSRKIEVLEDENNFLNVEVGVLRTKNENLEMALKVFNENEQILNYTPEEIQQMKEIGELRNKNVFLAQENLHLKNEIGKLKNTIEIQNERLNTVELIMGQKKQLEDENALLDEEIERLKSKNKKELDTILETKQFIVDKEAALKTYEHELNLKQMNVLRSIKTVDDLKEEIFRLKELVEAKENEMKEQEHIHQKELERIGQENLIVKNQLEYERVKVRNELKQKDVSQMRSPYEIPNFPREYIK